MFQPRLHPASASDCRSSVRTTPCTRRKASPCRQAQFRTTSRRHRLSRRCGDMATALRRLPDIQAATARRRRRRTPARDPSSGSPAPLRRCRCRTTTPPKASLRPLLSGTRLQVRTLRPPLPTRQAHSLRARQRPRRAGPPSRRRHRTVRAAIRPPRPPDRASRSTAST